jgi:hypothetical protein
LFCQQKGVVGVGSRHSPSSVQTVQNGHRLDPSVPGVARELFPEYGRLYTPTCCCCWAVGSHSCSMPCREVGTRRRVAITARSLAKRNCCRSEESLAGRAVIADPNLVGLKVGTFRSLSKQHHAVRVTICYLHPWPLSHNITMLTKSIALPSPTLAGCLAIVSLAIPIIYVLYLDCVMSGQLKTATGLRDRKNHLHDSETGDHPARSRQQRRLGMGPRLRTHRVPIPTAIQLGPP